MEFPKLDDPWRYEGLYAFDFGEWMSVGYTADEVSALLGSKEHGGGTAYRIYRVDGEGRVELKGVTDGELEGEELILFLGYDGNIAEADFGVLQAAAGETPLRCAVVVELLDMSERGWGLCLRYSRCEDFKVSRWLLDQGFAGGSEVVSAGEALRLRLSPEVRLVRCEQLALVMQVASRSTDEVLATVKRTVQR